MANSKFLVNILVVLIADVDATCSDFNFGTALHIAAYNLCASTVRCLLEHGANPAFRVRNHIKSEKYAKN